MKVNNDEIKHLVDNLQTQSNVYRMSCQKQISEISKIITNLREIHGVGDITIVEKSGKITS